MKKGEIWRALIPAATGHAQTGERPAIILQELPFNNSLPTTLIVPLTSKLAASRFDGTLIAERSIMTDSPTASPTPSTTPPIWPAGKATSACCARPPTAYGTERVSSSEEVIVMQTALRMETTVLPGHRLEITAPELPEGAKVEVIVVVSEQPKPRRLSMLEFLESLPPGPRAFKTWEEYERHLQEEKDAWER